MIVNFSPLQNYNKSRIHSSRGARLAEMFLDGRLIFRGELTRAIGGVGGAEGSEVSKNVSLITKFNFVLLYTRTCTKFMCIPIYMNNVVFNYPPPPSLSTLSLSTHR